MHPTVVLQNGFAIIWRRLEITCGDLGGERKCLKNEKKLRLQRRRAKMDVDVFPLCIQLFNFVRDVSKLELK